MTPHRFLFVAYIFLVFTLTNSYAQEKCAETFNPKIYFCYDGIIYEKCNGMQYNPSTHICTRGIAVPAICNGVNYNPLKQRCGSRGVQVKCGDSWLSSTQFCSNNIVYDKCGGKEYAPKTHHCSDAVIKKNYSGSDTLIDARDGKRYKTVWIGSHWMAENLNYEVEGSICYDNSDSNCDTYGRLYNWETAMKACPSGWHLPSDSEWQALMNFAGGSEVAGKKFKAKSGWNDPGNGTDEFGFSALPGGYGYDGNLNDVDINGYWWSSSSSSSYGAYTRDMSYLNSGVRRLNYRKSYFFSVRCLQD